MQCQYWFPSFQADSAVQILFTAGHVAMLGGRNKSGKHINEFRLKTIPCLNSFGEGKDNINTKSFQPIHFVIASHCISLHFTAFQCKSLIACHVMSCDVMSLHCIALHCIALHFIESEHFLSISPSTALLYQLIPVRCGRHWRRPAWWSWRSATAKSLQRPCAWPSRVQGLSKQNQKPILGPWMSMANFGNQEQSLEATT